MASGVGLMGRKSVIGNLRSWLENLEWTRMSKIREEGHKVRKMDEEPKMVTKIKGN